MTCRFARFCALLVTAVALVGSAQAQTTALQPLGIGLEGIDDPYPVHFFDLTIEGQALRMAYMDVAASVTPNGKAVVLLHGKSFAGDYWARTIATLASEGYRVIVPDQLGFGKSSKPDIRYHFDLLARNTKLLLESLGVARAAIVGHSFGGMLAVYFARDYPETTAVLALENPIGLEDYRSAIPPQPLEALVATEMAQTPASYHYVKHMELFDDGQLVALDGDRVVGATTTLRLDFDFDHVNHTFAEIIQGGWLTSHQPAAHGSTEPTSASILSTGDEESPPLFTRRGRKWCGGSG